jgi:hypothetical protein
MRSAVRPNDRLVRELVAALREDDEPYAATWRSVGKALEKLGMTRPSYELVRRLAGREQLRRERRAAVRRAQRDVAAAFFLSTRVVDTPIALDRLRDAKRDERLVTQCHEPSSDAKGDELRP